MKYLFLLYGPDKPLLEPGTPEQEFIGRRLRELIS